MSVDPAPACEPLSAEAVAAWLRAHPSFLAENPDLYRSLAPPMRVHGSILADHMTAMLRAERAHAAMLAERADGVLAAGRAAAGLTARVQDAVVALVGAPDLAAFITIDLPAALSVDAANLVTGLPAKVFTRLLGGRSVVFRDDGDEAARLHGAASALARHDALVRVPRMAEPALLALAARERAMLDPAQGTGALAFLGRALAAALDRAPASLMAGTAAP